MNMTHFVFDTNDMILNHLGKDMWVEVSNAKSLYKPEP